MGLGCTEGTQAVTGDLSSLLHRPTHHLCVPASIACLGLQHACVKAMVHTWLEQTPLTLFHYFPASPEDKGWRDPGLVTKTERPALEASGKAFTVPVRGTDPLPLCCRVWGSGGLGVNRFVGSQHSCPSGTLSEEFPAPPRRCASHARHTWLTWARWATRGQILHYLLLKPLLLMPLGEWGRGWWGQVCRRPGAPDVTLPWCSHVVEMSCVPLLL